MINDVENTKSISTKCTKQCKRFKIYSFVIQAFNPYVAPHTDSQSGDQSVIKGCGRGDQFLCQVYLGFRLMYFPATARQVPHCHLVQPMCVSSDRSLMQDILPEKQAHSWWCLGFRWGDFPNNSLLLLYLNFLETLCGCLPII